MGQDGGAGQALQLLRGRHPLLALLAGPCRITPKAPRGVCGIDADGMAMRNFLLQNTMGTATYMYHANEVFKTLAEATPSGTFEVKDWGKLETLAGAIGLEVEPKDTLPKRLSTALIAELARDHKDPSPLVKAFAPAPRQKVWEELGIFPGGALQENTVATANCLTNVNGDYVSLALKSLRLGIATAYGVQVPPSSCRTPSSAPRRRTPSRPTSASSTATT